MSKLAQGMTDEKFEGILKKFRSQQRARNPERYSKQGGEQIYAEVIPVSEGRFPRSKSILMKDGSTLSIQLARDVEPDKEAYELWKVAAPKAFVYPRTMFGVPTGELVTVEQGSIQLRLY